MRDHIRIRGEGVGITVDSTVCHAYVGNDGDHSISKVDVATSTVDAEFALPDPVPTANLIDVVLSSDGTRAYAALLVALRSSIRPTGICLDGPNSGCNLPPS